MRVCCRPGCPTLIPAGTRIGKCPPCARKADKANAEAAGRVYGPEHRKIRAEIVSRMLAGETVSCWRCGDPIDSPDDMHLGHDDNDRSITRGPEHRRCNLSAAGRIGGSMRPTY